MSSKLFHPATSRPVNNRDISETIIILRDFGIPVDKTQIPEFKSLDLLINWRTKKIKSKLKHY